MLHKRIFIFTVLQKFNVAESDILEIHGLIWIFDKILIIIEMCYDYWIDFIE